MTKSWHNMRQGCFGLVERQLSTGAITAFTVSRLAIKRPASVAEVRPSHNYV
jgi:hypothetical protein